METAGSFSQNSVPIGVTTGVSMEIDNISLGNSNVSFKNIEVSETTCQATQVSGYFTNHPMGHHHPDSNKPNATYYWVGTDGNNIESNSDSAGFIGAPKPWTNGSSTWNIPLYYTIPAINTPNNNGAVGAVPFVTNSQVSTIASDGTCTVSKINCTVTNSPTPN